MYYYYLSRSSNLKNASSDVTECEHPVMVTVRALSLAFQWVYILSAFFSFIFFVIQKRKGRCKWEVLYVSCVSAASDVAVSPEPFPRCHFSKTPLALYFALACALVSLAPWRRRAWVHTTCDGVCLCPSSINVKAPRALAFCLIVSWFLSRVVITTHFHSLFLFLRSIPPLPLSPLAHSPTHARLHPPLPPCRLRPLCFLSFLYAHIRAVWRHHWLLEGVFGRRDD